MKKEICETCEWRESEIGYPSPCPKHALPQDTPKEWDELEKIIDLNSADFASLPSAGYFAEYKITITEKLKSLIESTKQEERKKVQVDERMRAVEILHKYFMTTTRKESLDVIEIAQKEIMSDLSE